MRLNMTFTLPSLKSLVVDFVGMFVLFVIFSLVLRGVPQIVTNLIASAVWTFVWAVGDSLEPKPQRIFNLVIYGAVGAVLAFGAIFTPNTVSDLTLEIVLGIYCAYRFLICYNDKP